MPPAGELMPLAEAPRRVGEAVRFAAVVQQVSAGKRALMAARRRVAVYHALLLADPSAQFFKLTCSGDALPALPAADHSPQDTAIRVGDIVVFSNCTLKVFNGSVEAQFSPQTSCAQLLYRRDRYFNTRDVRLKDLYPMIEWYRQHRHEFELTDHSVAAADTAFSTSSGATRIKDLRENMVATVVCKLRRPQGTEARGSTTSRSSGPTNRLDATINALARTTSELDSLLLCELVMLDSPSDSMLVNLWDQHANKRAVKRLLSHRGAFRVAGVVVSLHATSNRLLANTTDQTTFQCLEASDPDALALENRLASGALTSTTTNGQQQPVNCVTMDDLEASACRGRHVLRDVRVEQIHFDGPVSSSGRVSPRLACRLVEPLCSVCEHPLVVQEDGEVASGADNVAKCVNNCEVQAGAGREAHNWRYCTLHVTLRDASSQRLVVQVDNRAVTELVGNIDAQTLVSSASPSLSSACARLAVASLLTALVASGEQTFDAEISCVVATPATSGDHSDSHSLPNSMALAYSGDHDSQQLRGRRLYKLTALVPTTQPLLPF